MRAVHSVLITGFGPFPGVEHNASADLARAVAAMVNANDAPASAPSWVAHTSELSVAWGSVQKTLADLYQSVRPTLAVHFGVSAAATGLVLEQHAHNTCHAEPDAEGCLPDTQTLNSNGTGTLTTRLPTQAIAAALRDGPVPVVQSNDAGGYLCNAAYYYALMLADQQPHPCNALFVHMPNHLRAGDRDWPAYVEAGYGLVVHALTATADPIS